MSGPAIIRREAIGNEVLDRLLESALRQGWLTAHDFDKLAVRVDTLPRNHQGRRLFAMVERRAEPPGTHHIAMLGRADTDQLWTCCLATDTTPRPGTAWVSSNAAEMIETLNRLMLARSTYPDRPCRNLRVVFDAAAVASTLDSSNCLWAGKLVHTAWACAEFGVRIELVTRGSGGEPLADQDIAPPVNVLMSLRRGEPHGVDGLTAEQLDHAAAVLKSARGKWPPLTASHAGAVLLGRQEQLHPRTSS